MTVPIRSTFHGRLALLRRETARLATRTQEAQRRLSTGLDLERPSDDPGRVALLHRLRAQHADQGVYQRNAAVAEGLLATADSALEGIGDRLARARELAVQMSSDIYDEDQREAAASEVDSLLEEVVGLANTDVGGRYLFAGTAYDSAPFSADGTYSGGSAEATVPVGDGLEATVGFDGETLLASDGDPFSALADLADAIRTGDSDAVADVLDEIDGAIGQVSSARARVGEELGRVDDARSLAESMETELAARVSDVQDADIVDAATRYTELQTAFQAALETIAASRTTPLFSLL